MLFPTQSIGVDQPSLHSSGQLSHHGTKSRRLEAKVAECCRIRIKCRCPESLVNPLHIQSGQHNVLDHSVLQLTMRQLHHPAYVCPFYKTFFRRRMCFHKTAFGMVIAMASMQRSNHSLRFSTRSIALARSSRIALP